MAPFVVVPAAPHELLPALRLVFARQADRDLRAEQCLNSLTAEDWAGVFVARDGGGELCGAILAQAMPGALGVVWPPRAEARGIEDALVLTACAWLRSRGVKVGQSFASADELPDFAPLERNGFARVTQLAFMSREVKPSTDSTSDLPDPLSVHAWGPDAEGFAAMLLASYEGSRDCPELTGKRTSAELLASHALTAAGRFIHRVLVSDGGEPVGVLLTDAGAEPDTIELSYLGVVPSARGRGLGRQLVQLALRVAAGDGARAMTLSVDAHNEPALRLYREAGFAETERCEVFLAQW